MLRPKQWENNHTEHFHVHFKKFKQLNISKADLSRIYLHVPSRQTRLRQSLPNLFKDNVECSFQHWQRKWEEKNTLLSNKREPDSNTGNTIRTCKILEKEQWPQMQQMPASRLTEEHMMSLTIHFKHKTVSRGRGMLEDNPTRVKPLVPVRTSRHV
jgi:hypothetical protein